jgi:mRNA interferase HigB
MNRMRLISRRPLKQFWEKHPDAETGLRHWIKAVETAAWKDFADLRRLFSSADQVGKFVVFNVGGNKYRLIVVLHYDRQRCYVRHILAHKEYDLGKWKKE